MESSSALEEPSAKASDEAPSALPEASTAKSADEALLEICKDMSATLQRLELHLTTRAQAAGTSAISSANIVDAATREQQNPTPDLINGHNEKDVPKIVGAVAREQQNSTTGIVSVRNEEEHLSQIGNIKTTSYDRVVESLPDIPPPPTVYYREVSLDNSKRIADEYGVAEATRCFFGDEVDTPREIVNLPQSKMSVNWKYYVPLFERMGSEYVQRGGGRGRTDFGWKWNLITLRPIGPDVWEPSLANFVPYSHILRLHLNLPNLFTEEQHAVFRELLGGLYSVPSDQRLALVFPAFELQQEDYDVAMSRVSEFLSFMKVLKDFGGSFTIQDYDATCNGTGALEGSGAALYGYKYKRGLLKATAQDAEEYFINIPPIRWDTPPGTSPWRRLIICEGFARLERGDFWLRGHKHVEAITLHLSNGRRTSADLDRMSSRNIFHINWFVLEGGGYGENENPDRLYTDMAEKPIWRHGTLYGSEGTQIGVTSFTIQASPFPLSIDSRSPFFRMRFRHEQEHSEIIDMCDSTYWTILVLTPIWYDRDRQNHFPMIDTVDIKIGSIQVTMLSGIKAGLSRAVESWIEIGDYLEKLLGREDIFLNPKEHDQFYFNIDHDLSQSKKFFWIINSVDKFDKSIQDTLYQWEWFYQTHIDRVQVELSRDIDLVYQELKDQKERFLSIQNQARKLRDGLFGASNLLNAKESVKEAKNSAHLGETVKLLTLVTIFFLPLGYVTSLWAIIATPNLRTFASVSVGAALATYLVVLAVIKWENISRAWFKSQNRITSSWNQVAKGSKSKSEKNKNQAKDDGKEQPKSRSATLRSRLHYRQGKNHGGVDNALQFDEISPA